jgi:hypothetical protein
MKRSFAFLPVLAALAVAEASEAAGRIRIEYVEPRKREYLEVVEHLRESGVHDSIAEAINEEIVLPRDVFVFFDECGEANAFYEPKSKSIIICYELFDVAASTFEGLELDEEEHAGAVLGVSGFFFLHEIGHALVDVLDIPVTGREEDAVDDLAGLILLQAEAEDAAFAAMLQFASLSENVDELAFWDEHSLDEQRFYSVACLIYGSDPETYGFLVGDDMLPGERAERCPEEFERKDRAWTALLEPHFRNP